MKDHEDLNSYYWATRYASDITNRQVKKHSNADASELLSILSTTSLSARSMGHSPAETTRRLKIADLWLRLSMLVFASSAFERYLKTVMATAIESDPLLVPGWEKLVDGLKLKKYGIPVPQRSTEGVLKGDWNQRTSSYKALFGSIPPALSANIGELDAIRKLRNLVAHEFGSDADPNGTSTTSLLVSISRRRSNPRLVAVSHDRLLKWLGVFEKVARDIDQHLSKEFIGDYEMAAIFLEWSSSPQQFEDRLGVQLKGHSKSDTVRFSSAVGPFVPSFGKVYESALRAYVQAL